MNSILVDATRKLIDLQQDSNWRRQLPLRSPPVLWFGNALSPKRRILTLGANPSRKEFLLDSADEACAKVASSGDQSLLCYLEPPKHRFRILRPGERMEEILSSEELQNQIINSYNSYFTHQPYCTWFGKNMENSYNVEGFLRGIGASYYDDHPSRLQAIHIDLFPFATLANFCEIKDIADLALFKNNWAQQLVARIVKALSPEILIVFGRTNCRYYLNYLDKPRSQIEWNRFDPAEYFVRFSETLGIPVVGLSTNLGNPKGFTKVSVRLFGDHIREAVKKVAPSSV
jgi:hypothetical protein